MPKQMTRRFNLGTQLWEEIEEEVPNSLEFLQSVYRDVGQPLNVRIRCAVEAAPYEHPKLSAVGVGYINNDTFASRLDRAIERSERALLIIEARAVQVDEHD